MSQKEYDNSLFSAKKKETDFEVNIAQNYESISISWLDSPNWTIHPFFSEIVKEATMSGDKDGFHVISIERRIWDRAVARYLADDLEKFEKEQFRKGVNTREENYRKVDEIIDSAFKEVIK